MDAKQARPPLWDSDWESLEFIARSRGFLRRLNLYQCAYMDLLEVCRTVLLRLDLEAKERASRGQDGNFLCAALRDDLRAAIAKAEGQ